MHKHRCGVICFSLFFNLFIEPFGEGGEDDDGEGAIEIRPAPEIAHGKFGEETTVQRCPDNNFEKSERKSYKCECNPDFKNYSREREY